MATGSMTRRFAAALLLAPLVVPAVYGLFELADFAIRPQQRDPGEPALSIYLAITAIAYCVAIVLGPIAWGLYRRGRLVSVGWYALSGAGAGLAAVLAAGAWGAILAAMLATVAGALAGVMFWLIERPDRAVAERAAG